MAYMSPEVQRANQAMAQQAGMGNLSATVGGNNPMVKALQGQMQGMQKPTPHGAGDTLSGPPGALPPMGPRPGAPGMNSGQPYIGIGNKTGSMNYGNQAPPPGSPGAWDQGGQGQGANPMQPGVNNSMKQGPWTSGAGYRDPNKPTQGMGPQDTQNNFMSSVLGDNWQSMMNPSQQGNAAAGYESREGNVKNALAAAFKQKFGADPTVAMSYDPWGQSNPAQATQRMMDQFKAAESGQGQVVNGKFYNQSQIDKYGMPGQGGTGQIKQNSALQARQGQLPPPQQGANTSGGRQNIDPRMMMLDPNAQTQAPQQGNFGMTTPAMNNLGAMGQPLSQNRGFGEQFNNGTGYAPGPDRSTMPGANPMYGQRGDEKMRYPQGGGGGFGAGFGGGDKYGSGNPYLNGDNGLGNMMGGGTQRGGDPMAQLQKLIGGGMDTGAAMNQINGAGQAPWQQQWGGMGGGAQPNGYLPQRQQVGNYGMGGNNYGGGWGGGGYGGQLTPQQLNQMATPYNPNDIALR